MASSFFLLINNIFDISFGIFTTFAKWGGNYGSWTTLTLLGRFFLSGTWLSGLILGLHPAIERRRYKVTPSLIGWAQAYNQAWLSSAFVHSIVVVCQCSWLRHRWRSVALFHCHQVCHGRLPNQSHIPIKSCESQYCLSISTNAKILVSSASTSFVSSPMYIWWEIPRTCICYFWWSKLFTRYRYISMLLNSGKGNCFSPFIVLTVTI